MSDQYTIGDGPPLPDYLNPSDFQTVPNTVQPCARPGPWTQSPVQMPQQNPYATAQQVVPIMPSIQSSMMFPGYPPEEPQYDWKMIDPLSFSSYILTGYEFVVLHSNGDMLFRKRINGFTVDLQKQLQSVRGELERWKNDNIAAVELRRSMDVQTADLMCRMAEVETKNKRIAELEALIAGKCAV